MLPDHRPYRALLHECLAIAAMESPEKTALHVGTETCSYRMLAERSDRLAAALQDRGLRRGDRVAIFMDNTIPCAISIFAVLKAGGVFVVINPQTKHDKLSFIANDCSIRHLITDVHLAKVAIAASAHVPTLTHIIFSGDGAERPSREGVATEWLEEVLACSTTGMRSPGTIPTDLAALIYTSGSTGNPKGVMQTHQSMVFSVGSLTEYQRLSADDVMLNLLPLAFDYGLYQLLMSVSLGAALVLERSFTYPAEVFTRMTRHRVTVFPGVPTIFAMMIAAHQRRPLEFPDVRRVTNTAAALPPSQFPVIRDIFPNALIYAMYGLTECKRVSYLPPELLDAKPGSVGIAIPGTEVYLRSPSGESVEPGAPGILHVRGPHVMRGYWNNVARTEKMLREGDIPGERVLCTGDWFRMDEDGYLYFISRSDDIIKTRGEKVSPAEVEAVLCAIPGIEEAAVIGVADEVLGQAICAFVVPSSGVVFDERRLRRELASNLENYMVPRDILLRETLPKNPNGKIDRKALAGTCDQEETQHDSATS
ncbi:class I adenylate-forming enzyme family protein [Thiocapsa marina]|uniref:Long-chain-fatty-acid--CoA ligase n=1 Tax=Thiocapsa marina 5811 TaxID=768671 RepID=F9UAU4_9GAMM|nr:AMP-binding protein [Thiocapsa marina]EGV18562.1 Long-chain-fatty-acid--CoA ligase [Thiocapsa marina 5811]